MTSEQPASNDQQNTRGQEANVVGVLMAGTFADVVQAENLMVGETLYEVEKATADEHPPEERASADCPPPVSRPSPQKPDADGDCHPRSGMKEAVGERVVFQTPHRGLGVIALAAQQVVPLEDLVEDDAVHETAESDPQQDARSAWPRSGFRNHFSTVRSDYRHSRA